MKVSIITVCYNEKKDIERTCKSIVAQNYDDFEWIVIDGGSDDGTIDILEKYRDHMTVFVSEKDHGVYNAMNKGIAFAQGEYVLFLNGGDALCNENVLSCVFANDQYTGDVLYGGCYLLGKNGAQKKIHFPQNLKKYFFYNYNINHQSTFIRKRLFDEYGNYDESYMIAADYEKWLCFMENHVHFMRVPFFISYYKAFDGLSTKKDLENITWGERQKIITKYFQQKNTISFHMKTIFYVLGTFHYGTIRNFIINRPVRRTVKNFWHFITFRKANEK